MTWRGQLDSEHQILERGATLRRRGNLVGGRAFFMFTILSHVFNIYFVHFLTPRFDNVAVK